MCTLHAAYIHVIILLISHCKYKVSKIGIQKSSRVGNIDIIFTT